MRCLAARDVLEVWEAGLRQHPIDRALTLLAAAWPELSRRELAALPVGERDARLLEVREQLFGSRLAGLFECSDCGERLEVPISLAELRPSATDARVETAGELANDGITLRFRVPDSRDLAAAVGAADMGQARRLLARRCVLEARRDGTSLTFDELPEATLDELAERLAACDPRAELLLEMACPACRQPTQILLDPGTFLWTELDALARRLLNEVRILARTYYWSESEILALSAVRRRTYLEMAAA